MYNLSKEITQHYHREDLYDSVLARLKAMRLDLDNIHRPDILGVVNEHKSLAQLEKIHKNQSYRLP